MYHIMILTKYGLVGSTLFPYQDLTKIALVLGDINVLDFIHKTV